MLDSAVIKEEYRKDWVNRVRKPGNFFKHADNDSEEVLEFSPSLTVLFMMFTIKGLLQLHAQPPDFEDIFYTWLTIHEPNFFIEKFRIEFNKQMSESELIELKAMPRSEFFEAAMIIKNSRAKKSEFLLQP